MVVHLEEQLPELPQRMAAVLEVPLAQTLVEQVVSDFWEVKLVLLALLVH
jgi:hypothetical protein